jgi:hypothetical protein
MKLTLKAKRNSCWSSYLNMSKLKRPPEVSRYVSAAMGSAISDKEIM